MHIGNNSWCSYTQLEYGYQSWISFLGFSHLDLFCHLERYTDTCMSSNHGYTVSKGSREPEKTLVPVPPGLCRTEWVIHKEYTSTKCRIHSDFSWLGRGIPYVVPNRSIILAVCEIFSSHFIIATRGLLLLPPLLGLRTLLKRIVLVSGLWKL